MGSYPYFGSVSFTLLSLEGSVNTDPNMGLNDNLSPGMLPLDLSLLAALDVNLSDNSTFLISNAVAGRDIKVGTSTVVECFGMYGALAGGNITLGSNSELLLTDLGQVNAGGTVDVHNNGANGMVIIDGATLAADVVKTGALGANGTLTVRNGSTLNAGSALKLYGGSSNGSVLFTGDGSISLNGSQIDIAAFKVQIDSGTSVINNGNTDIYANTHNYGAPNIPSSSFGSFTSPVTQHPVSSSPAY
jgi:hypothetical protein